MCVTDTGCGYATFLISICSESLERENRMRPRGRIRQEKEKLKLNKEEYNREIKQSTEESKQLKIN